VIIGIRLPRAARIGVLIAIVCALTAAAGAVAQSAAEMALQTIPGYACGFTRGENVPASRIPGCILGIDQTTWPIRVRAAGVNSSTILDARVSKSGRFSFKDLPMGDYVIVATQRGGILVVKTVRLPLTMSPVVIDVNPRRFQVQKVEY
jgi:hypothetical protein